MRTIWKFPLEVRGNQVLEMPAGSLILTVQVQDLRPCLWAEVDDKTPLREHVPVHTLGTGHQLMDGSHWQYVGTYQMEGGNLVWHVYAPMWAVARR